MAPALSGILPVGLMPMENQSTNSMYPRFYKIMYFDEIRALKVCFVSLPI